MQGYAGQRDVLMNVDIIIVHYYDLASLLKCLEALEQQSLKPNCVYIVDNSNDLPELSHDVLRLELLKPSKNLGFAAASNLAARQSQSDWLAFLNPDAFPLPDWLERLDAAIQNHPESVCFSSKQVFYENPLLLDGCGDVYHISGLYWRRGYRQSANRHYPKEVFSASGAAMLVKRQIFLLLEGFDERFFSYGEDVDFGFRLRLNNYDCLFCEEAIVQHIGYTSAGGRHSEFALYHGHRNLVWVFFKNMPWLFLCLLLPLHLALNLISLVNFSLKGQTKIIVRAKWDAFKGLGRMIQWRFQARAHRQISLAKLWSIFNKRLNRSL